jgi:hypothetical protein
MRESQALLFPTECLSEFKCLIINGTSDVVVGPGSSLQLCKGNVKKIQEEEKRIDAILFCFFSNVSNKNMMQFAMLPWSQKSKVVESSQRRRRDQTGATYHR